MVVSPIVQIVRNDFDARVRERSRLEPTAVHVARLVLSDHQRIPRITGVRQ